MSLKIEILTDKQIMVRGKRYYYIIKQEGKGFGLYERNKEDKSQEELRYITNYETMIGALKQVGYLLTFEDGYLPF